MVGRKNHSVGGVHGDPCRDFPQAPAVCICRTAEVTPAGLSFVQMVTLVIGNAFGPVDKALKENFVPELFKGLEDGVLERGVTRLPVKQARLAPPDPTQTAPENWTASCVITGHLCAALRGQVDLRTADHSACLREVQTAVWQRGQQRLEEAPTVTLEGALVQRALRL